jgi:hypothetical protein
VKKKLFQKHLCALLLISFTNKAVYSGCSENFCDNARIIPEREVTALVPIGDPHPLRYDHHKIEYTLDEECSWRAQATIAYRYYHSFHNDKLASVMLFPERYDGGSSLLSFQGTNFTELSTPARNPAALVAEYFGLGSATNSNLSIEPSITYNTIDMSFNFVLSTYALLCFVSFCFFVFVVKTKFFSVSNVA